MDDDEKRKAALKRLLDQLTPHEREVLKTRFGIDIDADASTQEIARQFDITREKIREIEKRVRDKQGSDDDPDNAA